MERRAGGPRQFRAAASFPREMCAMAGAVDLTNLTLDLVDAREELCLARAAHAARDDHANRERLAAVRKRINVLLDKAIENDCR